MCYATGAMSVWNWFETKPFARAMSLACVFLACVQCQASLGGEAQASPPTAARPSAPATPVTPAVQPEPIVVLEPLGSSPVRVRVEVAQTSEQRQRGLMYRKQLDPDAGMLFVFERPQHNVFWMHNTYLPLDMIFITRDWSVLGVVENATPQTDSPREVPGESLYVLEVNAGFSRQHGIAQGTKVRWIKAGATRQGT
jgi:uncharacterized membrane protein (UPF0127 family)